MEALPRLPVNFNDLAAHHPAQKINAMDALVHEAAAVLRPCAAPGGLIIVVPVAVPADVNRAVGEPSKTPGFERGASPLNGDVEAVLMTGRDEHATLLRATDDLVGIRHGHCHGLLDDYIHTGIDAVERDCGVLAALRGNGNEFELGMLLKHDAIVLVPGNGGIALQAMLCKNALHVLRHHVTYGNNIKLVTNRRSDVVGRDAATADKSIFHTSPPTESIGHPRYTTMPCRLQKVDMMNQSTAILTSQPECCSCLHERGGSCWKPSSRATPRSQER